MSATRIVNPKDRLIALGRVAHLYFSGHKEGAKLVIYSKELKQFNVISFCFNSPNLVILDDILIHNIMDLTPGEIVNYVMEEIHKAVAEEVTKQTLAKLISDATK